MVKVSAAEKEFLDWVKSFAVNFSTTVVSSELLVRLIEGSDVQVYGRCRYCDCPLSMQFNCCPSCQDERGP